MKMGASHSFGGSDPPKRVWEFGSFWSWLESSCSPSAGLLVFLEIGEFLDLLLVPLNLLQGAGNHLLQVLDESLGSQRLSPGRSFEA